MFITLVFGPAPVAIIRKGDAAADDDDKVGGGDSSGAAELTTV